MATEKAESYLSRIGVKFRRQGDELVIKCPVCHRKNKASVNNASFMWRCFAASCEATGNQKALRRAFGHDTDIPTQTGESLEELRERQYVAALKARNAKKTDIERWAHDLWHDDGARHAREYLRGRGLTEEVCRDVFLGWRTNNRERNPYGTLVIPALTRAKDPSSCAMVKLRSLHPDCPKEKRYQRDKGGSSVLFAPNGIDPRITVVIVGGEMDTLSALVANDLGDPRWDNVVSSTTGEGSWSDVFTRQLEQCQDILIVYDNDEGGRTGAQKLARILGIHRCRIGRWPAEYNDANDALKAGDLEGFTLQTIINQSQPLRLTGIASISVLRERVMDYLEGRKDGGTRSGWDHFDHVYGGWFDSAVTVMTGGTGCGKSTWMDQAALFQAEHLGRHCLVAPFETGPVALVNKWMRQWSWNPPAKMTKLSQEHVLNELDRLPMSIYDTDDRGNVELIRGLLMYAWARMGVEFVVLDHLHAMIRQTKDAHSNIEAMMEMFRQVVDHTGLHILLGAQPRKVQQGQTKHRDNAIIQLSDLKGGSAIEQWCDGALSIWKRRTDDRKDVLVDGYGQSIVYILKARDDDANEGRVAFRYHPESSRFVPPKGPVIRQSRNVELRPEKTDGDQEG